MPISMYDISVPVFDRRLKALVVILDTAAAHAATKNIDPAAFMTDRLYPDMFPLWLQVQAACDHAKNATARLIGAELPIFDSTVQTFDGLNNRIARTLEFVNAADPAKFEGAETRVVTLVTGGRERQMAGLDYFLNSGLPNFYFHLTTAYGILRHNGVELGKRDFIG
ncbi:MAG: DUF1993 domain-containing protein [Bauldia sp.]|nr:DUF1993 domain-containing protein [Bauldia sp.]